MLFTSFVPTQGLRLVVFAIVPSLIVTLTKYKLVTFHIERVCTFLHVMGPHFKSLTRDHFFWRAAIYDTLPEGDALIVGFFIWYLTHIFGVKPANTHILLLPLSTA
jgi:hypothetical protein